MGLEEIEKMALSTIKKIFWQPVSYTQTNCSIFMQFNVCIYIRMSFIYYYIQKSFIYYINKSNISCMCNQKQFFVTYVNKYSNSQVLFSELFIYFFTNLTFLISNYPNVIVKSAKPSI